MLYEVITATAPEPATPRLIPRISEVLYADNSRLASLSTVEPSITDSTELAITFAPISRITSYNVCYTKLLRIGITGSIEIVIRAGSGIGRRRRNNFIIPLKIILLEDIRDDPAPAAALDILIRSYLCGHNGRPAVTNRITSYNVCYTKLLRRGRLDVNCPCIGPIIITL